MSNASWKSYISARRHPALFTTQPTPQITDLSGNQIFLPNPGQTSTPVYSSTQLYNPGSHLPALVYGTPGISAEELANASLFRRDSNRNIFYDYAANVGIGTGSPQYALDVNGTIRCSNVHGSLIPDADIAYDLGSMSNKWRDLYLSGNTIILGDTSISTDATTGNIAMADTLTNTYKTLLVNSIQLVDSDNASNVVKLQTTSQGNLEVKNAGNVSTQLWTAVGSNVSTLGNVGIGKSNAIVALDIGSKDAIQLPVGTTGDRSTFQIRDGMIRYNNTFGQFEGASNGNWISLGGAAKVFSTAGADLYYAGGNVGIGTGLPTYTLDVSGDAHVSGSIYNSNLAAFSNAYLSLSSAYVINSNVNSTLLCTLCNSYVVNSNVIATTLYDLSNSYLSYSNVISPALYALSNAFIVSSNAFSYNITSLSNYLASNVSTVSNVLYPLSNAFATLSTKDFVVNNASANVSLSSATISGTTSTSNLTVSGATTLSGDASISGNVGVGTASVKAVTIGASAVSSGLTVWGAAGLSNSLAVAGTTTLSSDTSISGNVGIGTTSLKYVTIGGGSTRSALTAWGAVGLSNTLAVAGTTTLSSDTSITGNVGVGTSSTKYVTIGASGSSSGLTVWGAAGLSNTLAVANATTLGSTLAVTGITTLSADTSISGNVGVGTTSTKYVTIGASGSSSGLTVWGAAGLSNTLAVANATTLGSTLAVTGTTTLSSDTSISGNVGIGTSSLKYVTIGGSSTSSALTTFGAVGLSNTLTVAGTSKLSGNVTLGTDKTNTLTLNGNISVGTGCRFNAVNVFRNMVTTALATGTATTYGGSLYVTATGYFTATTAGSTATLTLNIDASSALTSSGYVNAANTTQFIAINGLVPYTFGTLSGVGTTHTFSLTLSGTNINTGGTSQYFSCSFIELPF